MSPRDMGKAFDKIQHPLTMKENLKKVRYRINCPYSVKLNMPKPQLKKFSEKTSPSFFLQGTKKDKDAHCHHFHLK